MSTTPTTPPVSIEGLDLVLRRLELALEALADRVERNVAAAQDTARRIKGMLDVVGAGAEGPGTGATAGAGPSAPGSIVIAGPIDVRLLAAAPALLDACRAVLAQAGHDDGCPESGLDAEPDTCRCWRGKVLAAVVKATGQGARA